MGVAEENPVREILLRVGRVLALVYLGRWRGIVAVRPLGNWEHKDQGSEGTGGQHLHGSFPWVTDSGTAVQD